MNFSIGSSVEITTKTKSNLLGQDYDIRVYKGKVVENPKWLGSDYVSVATGNEYHPVSSILKSFIVGYERSKDPIKTRIFKVTSRETKKPHYVFYSDGKASCDCLGYQFRQSCKHVKKVLDKVNDRC